MKALPFKVRRSEWQPLTERPDVMTADELRQWEHLIEHRQQAEPFVGNLIKARVVAVTTVHYRDRQESQQVAWIVGPRNRVVAPAAAARRVGALRALATGALIGALIALVGALLLIAMISR